MESTMESTMDLIQQTLALMGMPELRMPVSDTRAYWQLGNSVVPPLVETITAHLMS